MTLRDFLLDRATYLIAFIGALALALTVVGLAGAVRDRPLSTSNLGYIGLLALFCLGCYVVRDYTRQRAFLAQMAALLERPELTSFAVLDHPATREQAVVCDLIRLQHRLSRDELNAYQRQQEINSVFMNRWAHQMKTPVAVIDATLQEEERAGHCPAELLTSLREETDKLASGLELMLSSARLGEFRSDFVVHRTDLVELVRHSINNHRRAFIRRGVYPSLTVPPEPVLADTDEKWLRFVVDQLLTNAINSPDPGRNSK
jgi:signal transduction histidine kinase